MYVRTYINYLRFITMFAVLLKRPACDGCMFWCDVLGVTLAGAPRMQFLPDASIPRIADLHCSGIIPLEVPVLYVMPR